MIQIAWANGETKSSRMEHREDYFWLKLNLVKSANKFRTTKKSIGPKKIFQYSPGRDQILMKKKT